MRGSRRRDTATGHLPAGDCFGLSYRELDDGGRQFAFPTTSPSQFDPPALQHTAGRCRNDGEARFPTLKEGVTAGVLAERARQGWPVSEEKTLEIFALDIELNGAGTRRLAGRKRQLAPLPEGKNARKD
ncbi:MAG: hypothetical protein O3A91_07150 [Proteobacteria bacterium]|nr:hypothetical protein [Pseudomonadota bacterium]